MKGNENPRIKQAIPALVNNTQVHTSNLLERAMELEIDTLQPFVRNGYHETWADRDWKRGMTDYLAAYPEQQDRDFFVELLEAEETDFFIRRRAAWGLSQLKNPEDARLIIRVTEKERATSEFNTKTYLFALANLGGEEARAYVEQFSRSQESSVKQVAVELLENWND